MVFDFRFREGLFNELKWQLASERKMPKSIKAINFRSWSSRFFLNFTRTPKGAHTAQHKYNKARLPHEVEKKEEKGENHSRLLNSIRLGWGTGSARLIWVIEFSCVVFDRLLFRICDYRRGFFRCCFLWVFFFSFAFWGNIQYSIWSWLPPDEIESVLE